MDETFDASFRDYSEYDVWQVKWKPRREVFSLLHRDVATRKRSDLETDNEARDISLPLAPLNVNTSKAALGRRANNTLRGDVHAKKRVKLDATSTSISSCEANLVTSKTPDPSPPPVTTTPRDTAPLAPPPVQQSSSPPPIPLHRLTCDAILRVPQLLRIYAVGDANEINKYNC